MKLASLIAAGLIVATPAGADVLTPREAGRDVMVIAHRACWEGGAPEVSVAAIRACEAIGPDMVEIDVRKTRDGELVLMHDATVDRTTSGTGAVADMTAAQFLALRLRAGSGGPQAPLTQEHPPTLEEGLRAAKGRFSVNLHLYVEPEPAIAAIVQRLGMEGQVTTWIGDKPTKGEKVKALPLGEAIMPIPIVKQCAEPAAACWVSGPSSLMSYAPYRPAGFYVIPNGKVGDTRSQAFIGAAAAAVRPEGTRIMASTLFDIDNLPSKELQAEWDRLIDLGVDMIMTDRPAALLTYLRKERHSRE